MATTRMRRAAAHAPANVDADGDRVYTEEDYAADAILDEWEAEQPYGQGGWTGEEFLPDEAFTPDESELPPDADWVDEAAEALAYEPYFDDDPDFTDDLDPLAEDLLTEEEQQELRRSRWQLLAGLVDFAGVVAGTAVILVLITLLVSLINWLINDMSQSFILLQKHL